MHDALVRRLVTDAAPVRPLRSAGVRMIPWLGLEAVNLAIAVALGLRASLPAALHHPLLVADLGMLLAAGLAAAAVALHAAVPGQEAGRLGRAAALALGVAAVLLMLLEPGGPAVPEARFVAEGARCTLCTLGLAVVPALALFAALRRGAPLDGAAAGAWAGAAAFLVAAAAVRIGCPIDERFHLAVWHLPPLLGGAAFSALLGVAWLERWQRPAKAAGCRQ